MNRIYRSQSSQASGSVLFVLYGAHLLVPAFLLLDVATHWHDGGRIGLVVLIVCASWLAAGVLLPLVSNRTLFLRRIAGPLTTVYAVVLTVILLESIVLIVPGIFPRTPLMRRPGTRVVTEIDPKILPGVSGPVTFSINEWGLRGPSFPKKGHPYEVITVGGSTTECTYLDASREWPHLLMLKLNEQQHHHAWVANAGLSGQTTVGHLMLLRTLPALRQADLLIFQTGANDLMASLAFQGASTQGALENEADGLREALLSRSRPRFPLFKRLAVFALARRTYQLIAAADRFRSSKRYLPIDYVELRRERASAKLVPLPDLQIGLQEYGARVLHIQQECQALVVRCLFLTQPSMWREDLGEAERNLLWFGWVGRKPSPIGYISVADAAAAIEAFNQTLLRVCREHSLECFDLAPRVPKDTSAFYDDFHFNDGGARLVADEVAAYLLTHPPLSTGRQAPQ